jgi:hypothetical protein
MMRPIALLLLATQVTLVSAAQQPFPLQLTRLELNLRLDYDRAALGGTATLVVRNLSGRPVSSVPLLLNRLMRVGRVTDGRGKALSYRQRITVYSDDPSWEINRTIAREPFHFRAAITVPKDETVATGGVLDSVAVRDSLATWNYSSRDPVPFLNLTVAPYAILRDSATTIYHFPADSAGADGLRQGVTAALARFRAWYGDLPSAPHLVIMEIPGDMGSQASLTGGIIQTADAFQNRSELPQVYHELSHLWNVPDADRPSSRWNEGLASFLQWRMAAELDGWSDWAARVERVSGRLLQECAAPAPCRSTPLADYGKAGSTDQSYRAGFLMFCALYRVMGSASFDRAYRGYFQENKGRGGTLKGLRDAFQSENAASSAVFADWLTSTRWYDRLSSGETFDRMVEAYSSH